MSSKDDSRPFVDLRQKSEAFIARFDKDIKSCLNILESNLSTLLKDPDSLESPTKEAKRLGAEIQFSKAKLNIFTSLQNELNQIENEWNAQLRTMVHSFLENVEILLASLNFATSFSKFVLNSFLSQDNDEEEEESDDAQEIFRFQDLVSDKLSQLSEKYSNEDDEDEMDDEEDEIQESTTQPKSSIPIRFSRSNSQASPTKEAPVKSSEKRPVGRPSLRSKTTKAVESAKSTPKKNASKNKKSILKMDPANDVDIHATPSRATRNKTAVKESIQANDDDYVMECNGNDPNSSAAPKTPKNVHFSVGLDVEDDLEIYSPEAKLTRSVPRRKTVLIPNVNDSSSDFNLTPNTSRSKRKTIGGSGMDVTAPSAKRFKRGKAPKVSTISEEIEESDHLENDASNAAEHYTPWILLDDLDGKVPAQPGIYELKVYKAKKSAYIGSCDNIRQKLTLHKLGQNSGRKHLDKYLERNKKDVQVRYERMDSANAAKNEAMNRIKEFSAEHGTSPAFN